jgi:hypothetical protein
VYVSATDVSGNNFTLIDSSVAPGQVNLTLAQIPAGKQAIIEVHARVANNTAANAGMSFLNSASYTYADTAGGAKKSGGTGTTAIPLRIIEPVVTLTKSVSNQTKPGVAPTVGDVLRYTLVFQAAGGANTDSYSSAFDLSIAEALTLATKLGVNVDALLPLIQASMVRSGVVEYKAPFIMRRDFTPNFPLRLMLKDLRLILEAAKESRVKLPALRTVEEIYDLANEEGHGDLDYAATLMLLEKWAGVEVKG